MKIILAIGIGSFIGGIARYLVTILVQSKTATAFPYGTLLVNIAGCFLIGLVYSLSEKGGLSVDWRLFLATGILGGFTTFSAFSMETVFMLREGLLSTALLYVTLSVFLGFAATALGFFSFKLL